MKSLLPVIIIIFVLSGCTRLSETKYVTVEGGKLKRKTDSCEYYDLQWALFGRGNYSEISGKEIQANFCSTVFYSKDLTTGPILPIIPLPKSVRQKQFHGEKWLRVKNTHPKRPLQFKGIFQNNKPIQEIEFYSTTYPETPPLEENRNILTIEGTVILSGERIWVNIPTQDNMTIVLQSSSEIIELAVIESIGYSWWMVTV